MAPPVEFYRAQNYAKLKKQCQKEGKLFTDPEFPAAHSSLFFDPTRQVQGGVEWKRPKDIVGCPRLFVDGAGVNDVVQGILGNCWFVSACSVLTHHKTLLKLVIPDADEQEWEAKQEDRYAGIFHFCFFRFGKWVDVVVDDLLPVSDGKLIFGHSKTKNEFWSALLEKAFAKLSGCYESLIGGTLNEALMDVSGGLPETLDLTTEEFRTPSQRLRFFDQLKEAFDNKALIAAAIAVKTKEEMEKPLENGLVKGHSYGLTAVRHIELDAKNQGLLSLFHDNEKILMVRLQNPWGEKEWNGPWSDCSQEWDQVTDDQKKELGLTFSEDGEFWMTWEDFCDNFTEVSVCHLVNTSWFSFAPRFVETEFSGAWRATKDRGHPDDRAGGCLNFKATCFSNPQYRFDIRDESTEPVMIVLTQRDIRQRRKHGEDSYLTIGVHVMKIEENRRFRVHQSMPSEATSRYVNSRSVFLRMKNLKKGRYLVLPTTYAPGEEGEFHLRIFSPHNIYAKALTEHKPIPSCCACCVKKIACVSRVKVLGARNLHNINTGSESVDPYCIITCEKQKVRTPYSGNNANPDWDLWAIFYRKNPQKPILFELYDSNYLRDSYLGSGSLRGETSNDSKRVELSLQDRAGRALSGKLILEVATYDDAVYL